mgnify:CR=1 FL=1
MELYTYGYYENLAIYKYREMIPLKKCLLKEKNNTNVFEVTARIGGGKRVTCIESIPEQVSLLVRTI